MLAYLFYFLYEDIEMWIIVSGSVSYSTFIYSSREIAPMPIVEGDLSMAMHVKDYHTWSGHDIAYALGSLWRRDRTILVSSVGYDFIINPDLESLVDYGWLCVRKSLHTSRSRTIIDKERVNSVVLFHNMVQQSPTCKLPVWDYTYIMVAPSVKHVMMDHVLLGKQRWLTVFFDPWQSLSTFSVREIQSLITSIDYITLNRIEADQFASLLGIAYDDIHTLFPNTMITRDEDGIEYRIDGNHGTIASYPVSNIRSTFGAGDAWRWWMLTGLLAGKSHQEAMIDGCIVASYVLETDKTLWYPLNQELLQERREHYKTLYGI